jgi:HAD superfamily hydrolase (TIGR01509 family)
LKLIVWDFDGTLVDSRPLIEAGMEHALAGLGLQDQAGVREAWLKGVGLPVEEGLRRVFEPLGIDSEKALKVYRSFDWAVHERLLRPFPGMTDLLAELRRLGISQAIATSKRRVPLLRQLDSVGWTGLFDPLVTPDEVQHGKPHPESLQIILRSTGLDPEDLLMVGDTPFDLEMARAAGVPSLAVGHGFYDPASLLPCDPRAFAPDAATLREILLAWIPSVEVAR